MLFQNKLKHELFINAISTLLILSGIVIAQRGVVVFRLASKGIIPNDSVLTILVFGLTKNLPLLISLTLFLAVLSTLTRWYKDSEMIIWFSSGLGISSLIRPILAFCTPIFLFIGFLSFYLSPWAIQKAEEYKAGLENRDELAVISPGVFKESKNKDEVFYIEGLSDFGNKVKNVFVQSTQNGKSGIVVSNQGKRITTKFDDEYIVLEEGKRYEVDHQNKIFSQVDFKEYGFLVEKKLPTIIETSQISAKPTLLLFLEDGNRNKAELAWRAFLPISSIVLVFLAIPLSFINPRSGRSANIIIALMLFAIYNNLMGVTQSYISLGKINPILGCTLNHLIFVILSGYLLHRRSLNLPLIPEKFKKLKFRK